MKTQEAANVTTLIESGNGLRPIRFQRKDAKARSRKGGVLFWGDEMPSPELSVSLNPVGAAESSRRAAEPQSRNRDSRGPRQPREKDAGLLPPAFCLFRFQSWPRE